MSNKRFDDLDEIDISEEAPLTLESAVSESRIITYGTMDRRKVAYQEKKIKIPMWVIELIEKHAEDGSNHTLIYSKMLEIAAAHYRKKLLISDVEIKY